MDGETYQVYEAQDNSIIGNLYDKINYLYWMDLLGKNKEQENALANMLEKLKNEDTSERK